MGKVYPQEPAFVPPPPSSSGRETFTVWMKSLVFQGNGCTVFNSDGEIVYRMDNYDTKCSSEVYLMDLQGKVLFTILRRVSTDRALVWIIIHRVVKDWLMKFQDLNWSGVFFILIDLCRHYVSLEDGRVINATVRTRGRRITRSHAFKSEEIAEWWGDVRLVKLQCGLITRIKPPNITGYRACQVNQHSRL